MRVFHLLVACLILFFSSGGAMATESSLLDTRDVFNQLQQNVWYLPTSDKAAKLYVTEVGQGAPVVFLHGGPGNDFNYIIDALRPQLADHRFILFDQRGSLLSPVAPDQVDKLTLAQLVGDLEALRVALGQDKLALFGHSYGTVLAMAYYQAHPDHVERMVLAGALPPAMSIAGGEAVYEKALDARQMAMMARPEIKQALAAAGLPADKAADTPQQARMRQRIQFFAPSNIVDLRHWRELTGAGIYYNGKVGAAIGASVPADMDIRPTLAAHPVPVTVIQGDRDYVDPGAQNWSTLAKAGKVELHVMHAAAHYAWIDQPKAFADALRDGLDRTTGH
ncbi:alpha/beta fold hydrolase [Rhodanobacter sp. Col0626]|uniref:alpha/beta fold hydrolase n=1 Tax=Rhodanobacter sp. Col0626 TaxID=3415679 RepID=UPI003CEF58D7